MNRHLNSNPSRLSRCCFKTNPFKQSSDLFYCKLVVILDCSLVIEGFIEFILSLTQSNKTFAFIILTFFILFLEGSQVLLGLMNLKTTRLYRAGDFLKHQMITKIILLIFMLIRNAIYTPIACKDQVFNDENSFICKSSIGLFIAFFIIQVICLAILGKIYYKIQRQQRNYGQPVIIDIPMQSPTEDQQQNQLKMQSIEAVAIEVRGIPFAKNNARNMISDSSLSLNPDKKKTIARKNKEIIQRKMTDTMDLTLLIKAERMTRKDPEPSESQEIGLLRRNKQNRSWVLNNNAEFQQAQNEHFDLTTENDPSPNILQRNRKR